MRGCASCVVAAADACVRIQKACDGWSEVVDLQDLRWDTVDSWGSIGASSSQCTLDLFDIVMVSVLKESDGAASKSWTGSKETDGAGALSTFLKYAARWALR